MLKRSVKRSVSKRSISAAIATLIALGCFSGAKPVEATPSGTFAFSDAYCEYYPKNKNQAIATMPCSFIQDEAQVNILWADGVYSEFAPIQTAHDSIWTGLYVDQRGGMVQQMDTSSHHTREFQMEAGSLYIYLR